MAKILVVEDDPDILKLILVWLLRSGHSVSTAETGAEALAQIEDEGPPDLAVVDVMMPGMSGFELVAKLRTNADTADLAVIFLSARVGAEDKEVGRALGAIAYMAKPFVGQHLLEEVSRAIEERAAARDLGTAV